MNKQRPRSRSSVLPALAILAAQICGNALARAQESGQEYRAGQFAKISGTVDDATVSRIRNLALKLQNQAEQEDREVVLVLEITGGASRFGQVRDLAKFLRSPEVNRLKTVAWLDSSVTGKNVILALACNEIVMHPDAEIGDIGRGEPVDDDEKQFVLNMVKGKHNNRVSPALAEGLMDRDVGLWLVTKVVDGGKESQVLNRQQRQDLLDANVVLEDVIPIKEAGSPNVFSGRVAGANGFLVVQSRESRRDVADLYRLPLEAMREAAVPEKMKGVRYITIEGHISRLVSSFVVRQIDRAIVEEANVLIFKVDARSGNPEATQDLANVIADLGEQEIRTIAYVPEKAIDLPALVALACDEIYMHPSAQLGGIKADQLRKASPRENEDEVFNVLRTNLRSIAKRKGRPEGLYVAMNDSDLEVFKATHVETGRTAWMTAAEIDESNGKWKGGNAQLRETREDELLTIDGQRAHELELAMSPVNDLEELQVRVGLPPETRLVPVGPTWVDTLVFALNTDLAMFLLVVFGVAFIYMELHFMTGLLGIMSAVCFGVFFWSRFLGGTAGYLEIILFVIGIGCIAMEIFVMPGFGVFGLSGGLLVIASLILAANTYTFGGSGDDLSKLTPAVGTLAAAVVCFTAGAFALNQFLPKMPFFNKMVLTPPGADEDGPMLRPEFTLAAAGAIAGSDGLVVGERGQAASKLRPAGKAQVGDKFVDVVSDGPFINAGTPIEVVSVQGNKITVRAVDASDSDF